MDSDKTVKPVTKCMHPGCKKKIGFVDRISGLCNCGNTYCVSHKPDLMHGCTFDYKSRDRNILTSTLTKVVADKISVI